MTTLIEVIPVTMSLTAFALIWNNSRQNGKKRQLAYLSSSVDGEGCGCGSCGCGGGK